MLPIRTVLHPTDFSEESAPAMEIANALAKDYNAKLVLAHVCPPEVIEGVPIDPLPASIEIATMRLESIRIDPGIRAVREVVAGNPAEKIVGLAARHGADLIVIGTHGRTGLSRLFNGSVAESVQRTAPCPVLSVRAPFPLPLMVSSSAAVSTFFTPPVPEFALKPG